MGFVCMVCFRVPRFCGLVRFGLFRFGLVPWFWYCLVGAAWGHLMQAWCGLLLSLCLGMVIWSRFGVYDVVVVG